MTRYLSNCFCEPCQKAVTAAEVMVIPRSCSCTIQSVVEAPSWVSPILWFTPV
ncbi:hypothetical protein D3C77_638590 [compost metagenome]